MKKILAVQGGGRAKGNTAQLIDSFVKGADCIVFASPLYFWTISSKLKAFIERFYCIAEEDPDPPLGRYEKYPVKDCALLMTSAYEFGKSIY